MRVSLRLGGTLEALFLVTGILVFAAGMCLTAAAFIIPYLLIDEINERSPVDQQIDSFPRISEAMWRRHRELFPNSPKRRQMTIAAVAAVLMMLAGACLLSDYGSLHDLARNRAVAPRQQTTAGTMTGGPAGRNSYSYTFAVGGITYSDLVHVRTGTAARPASTGVFRSARPQRKCSQPV